MFGDPPLSQGWIQQKSNLDALLGRQTHNDWFLSGNVGRVPLVLSTDRLTNQTTADAGTHALRGDIIHGTTPEGSIKADVGTTCKNPLLGQLYVKASGTEKTGWERVRSVVAPESITATSDGLTTGLISVGVTDVVVTSTDTGHIVTLPPIVMGMPPINGTGTTMVYEIRTLVGGTDKINGLVTGGNLKEAQVPTNGGWRATAVDTDRWRLEVWTAAGVVSAPAPN